MNMVLLVVIIHIYVYLLLKLDRFLRSTNLENWLAQPQQKYPVKQRSRKMFRLVDSVQIVDLPNLLSFVLIIKFQSKCTVLCMLIKVNIIKSVRAQFSSIQT